MYSHKKMRFLKKAKNSLQNLLVPVGGSIVAGPVPATIEGIGKGYPGRASITPVLDVFMTLLSLGRTGYTALLQQRKELLPYCQQALAAVAAKHGERLLHTPGNTISIGLNLVVCSNPWMSVDDVFLALGMSLASVAALCPPGKDITFFGAILFGRCVSGTRVINTTERSKVGPLSFTVHRQLMSRFPPLRQLIASLHAGIRRAY